MEFLIILACIWNHAGKLALSNHCTVGITTAGQILVIWEYSIWKGKKSVQIYCALHNAILGLRIIQKFTTMYCTFGKVYNVGNLTDGFLKRKTFSSKSIWNSSQTTRLSFACIFSFSLSFSLLHIHILKVEKWFKFKKQMLKTDLNLKFRGPFFETNKSSKICLEFQILVQILNYEKKNVNH